MTSTDFVFKSYYLHLPLPNPPPPKKTQALYFLFFLIYTDVFLWPAQLPSSHLKSLSYLSNNVFCFTYPDFVFWPAPLDSHIESVCSHGCKIKDRNYFRVRPKNTNVCSELPEKSTRNVFDEVLQLFAISRAHIHSASPASAEPNLSGHKKNLVVYKLVKILLVYSVPLFIRKNSYIHTFQGTVPRALSQFTSRKTKNFTILFQHSFF